MGVARLQINALVQVHGVDHRIHRKIGENLWQLEEIRTRRIEQFELDALLRKIQTGELKFQNNDLELTAKAANFNLSEKDEHIAKVRRQYVIKLLDVPNTQSRMEPAILETWRGLGEPASVPGWITVYAWKKRYIAAGEDFRALVDNNHRKGNRKQFPAEVRQLTQLAIEATYKRRERSSIKATLDEALIRVMDENKNRPAGLKPLKLPTRRFVKRLIDEVPAYDLYVAQRGREEARRHFRSVKGHRITERPLQRAEMDHTVLDVIVLDERHLVPLGRPYLTACIDDYTRCILGFYLGFTPPSSLSVAQCLKQVILPKADLREKYPQIQHDWPAFGVMGELVIDNGREFHGGSLAQVCLSLGCELHYAPRHTPWFKGKIERFFGTINQKLVHTIPGTTFHNILRRGDYDSLSKACITLSELKKLLCMLIVDDYHQSTHSALGVSPHEIWKSSIRAEDIWVPNADVCLDAIVGTVEKRKLRHTGIQISDLFYNSPALDDLRRQVGPGVTVDVRIDEADLGKIFVFPKGASVPIAVPALHQQYASGLSLWAHEICKKRANEHTDDADRSEKLLRTKKMLQTLIEQSLKSKTKWLSKRAARFIEGTGPFDFSALSDSPAEKVRAADRQLPRSVAGSPISSAFSFDAAAATADEPNEDVPIFEARLKEY